MWVNNDNQKIRWTQSAPEKLAPSYNYIGESSRVEFDLLIELLWYKYEDANIDINELKSMGYVNDEDELNGRLSDIPDDIQTFMHA